MTEVRFSDLGAHDVVALGLPAGRFGLLGAGIAGIASVAHLGWAEPWRLGCIAAVSAITALMAWGRFEGLEMSEWSLRGMGWTARWLGLRAAQHSAWLRIDQAHPARDSSRAPSRPWVRRSPGAGWDRWRRV